MYNCLLDDWMYENFGINIGEISSGANASSAAEGL